jgi:anti-sigma regulatory factor (Ser/Thr protein kinase)
MAAGSPATLKLPAGSPLEHGHGPADGFRHEALLYADGCEGFVREVLPMAAQAVGEGAPVMIAAGEDRLLRLREALGEKAAGAIFADTRRLGTNPARLIPTWREFLRRERAEGTVPLGIVEPVWPGRDQAELDECARHEALLGRAFGRGEPWRLLCAYDLEAIEEPVIAAALREHPILRAAGTATRNARHRGPRDPLDVFAGRLEPPAGNLWEIPFGPGDLGELRRLVSAWARREAMPFEATEDLVLAVDEIAANSIRHGGGMGMLRLWRSAETLVCEAQDGGLIEDQLVGRVQPDGSPATGRGVWIANQLCDLVQIRSGLSGTQVRLHKRLG